jgi:hypothetical protein
VVESRIDQLVEQARKGDEEALEAVVRGIQDRIYIYNDMLFNGSKNVDGRAFDKPENRPTNLQIPLVRQK